MADLLNYLILDSASSLTVGRLSAKISSAVAFPVFESTIGPVQIVLRHAQEPLKAAVVERVCRGEAVVGIAMSEPRAGPFRAL